MPPLQVGAGPWTPKLFIFLAKTIPGALERSAETDTDAIWTKRTLETDTDSIWTKRIPETDTDAIWTKRVPETDTDAIWTKRTPETDTDSIWTKAWFTTLIHTGFWENCCK